VLTDIRNNCKIPKAVSKCTQLQSLTFLTGEEQKNLDETEFENKLIRAKVFKVYKNNTTDSREKNETTDKSRITLESTQIKKNELKDLFSLYYEREQRGSE